MSNKNLTKTLFADFRKVDTKKLNINGNPFSKVVTDHVPETPTEDDIWKYAVTTDENGVVTITDDVAVDYTELTSTQKSITKTAIKVIDNKVLDANDQLLMNWDTKNFTSDVGVIHIDEENGSIQNLFGTEINMNTGETSFAPITEWNSDLSSLTNGMGMFYYCTALASFNGDLPSLTNGERMFYKTSLESFSGDLSSLTNGFGMFIGTSLTSWNLDLPSLTGAHGMFYLTRLESFSGDLSSLTNGQYMFSITPLYSFNSDLPSLISGRTMFQNNAFQSFIGDLPRLIDGKYMFFGCTNLTSFNGDLSNLTDGHRMFSGTHIQSFISDLSSLKCGYEMFHLARLDEESIMFIADTINDISSLDKTDDSDWTYTTYHINGNLTTETISSEYRGVFYLDYNSSSITDTTNIFSYCNEIVDKGWTVYLNGSEYTSTDSDSTALIDGESISTPIPHYYKPVQVTDEEVAEYVDGNGNYYIIIGAQHVFGDDISTYGMFTSHQHAVSEITSALGLTPYEKPAEEPKYNILY